MSAGSGRVWLTASTLVTRYGEERARALFALSLDAIAFLEALVSSEGIDADYRRTGHLEAAFKPSHFDDFRREQELLASATGVGKDRRPAHGDTAAEGSGSSISGRE